MKISFPSQSPHPKGTSLIEAIIAVGVLAVAVPLVFGTMMETGNTSSNAQADTRSSWIAGNCFTELQQAMAGNSKLLADLTPGEAFPSGGVTALAFSSEGKAIKRVSTSEYSRGTRGDLSDPIRYIASMSGELSETSQTATPNLQVTITVEYPAAAPAEKRQKIEFYTVVP